MARLLLLNGMPGLGKSTLAERLEAADPGWVVLDIDRSVPAAADGAPRAVVDARTQALSRAHALLVDGSDVVVPQLVARVDQLARFEQVTVDSGGGFVHVLLVDDADDPVGRFHRRRGEDPWHGEVRALVADAGGDAVLRRYADGLAEVRAARSQVHVVRSVEGDLESTWSALVAVLASP